MDIETKRAKIKGFIADSGSKFMSIDFIKKDGSLRTMNFNPISASKNLVENPSDSAIQATATRKRNNPQLLNIWEMNNSDDSTKFRSINMDTVTRVACGKLDIRFVE
jgi:hypothetical protein